MAVVNFVVSYLKQGDSVIPGVNIYTWPNMKANDIGQPVIAAHFADRSIQFLGAFSGGSRAQFKGSNEGTVYELLTDPQGNDIDKVDHDAEAVTEVMAYVRPEIIGGDGGESITAVLLIRAPT
jgi:hypothetical protein